MKEEIILDVTLDTGKSLTDAAKLRDELILLKEAQKENKRETQEQKDLYEAQSASIKSVQERLNLLTQAVKNQETAVKSNNGSFNQLQASLKVGEASLKALTGTMKKNADGTIELTKEYFDNKKQVDEAKNALLLFNAGIAQGNLNVGNYDNTLAGMRQKLADLQIVVENTDVGSQQFQEAQMQIEKTKQAVQEFSGQYDSMGNRIAKNPVKDAFMDAQGAAQALTGTIGILSLAIGDDTKAGETLRKVTIGLTVAQTALTIAKSKDDIVGAALIVRTKALAAAQWALNNASKAFLSLGIGAAVAGITYLFSRQKKETVETNEAQEDLNESISVYIDSISEISETQKRQIRLNSELTEDEIERLNMQKNALQTSLLLNESYMNSLGMQERLNKDDASRMAAEADLQRLKQENLDLSNEILIIENKINKEKEKNHKEQLKRDKEAKEKREKEIQDSLDAMDDYYNRLIEKENEYRASLDMTAWEYYQQQLEIIERVKNETVKQYDAMGEEIVEIEKGSQDDVTSIIAGAIQKRKEQLEKENQEQAELISDLAQTVGQIFADSLTQTGLDLKKFSKGVISLVLDQLEKTLVAAQVQILAKELSTKSFAGIATAAIQIGLITAAFEGVKALLNSEPKAEFYEGGYTGEGNPRTESKALGEKPYVYHKDEYVVPSKVLNDPQGAQLVMALEDMRVNNPFKIGGIGKADGGFYRGIATPTGLTAKDIAQIKMFVSVTELRDVQNKVLISEGVGVL